MLVLSRKVGECIVVPDYGITLTVLKVEGGKVRLGISADASVPIYRQELWEEQRAICQLPALPRKG
jgi:carbon storage regulator